MVLKRTKKVVTWTLSFAILLGCAGITPTVFAAESAKDKGAEKQWEFTYFGQSSNGDLNTFEMVDEENLTFKLNSCSIKEDGTINKKGGKFTTFHDGISYYYTKIDADTENFELTGTFTVDYINTTADGQEGFGIIAMDSLGQHGVSMTNHYTNSAAILATKFGSLKDVLGTRFVSGITEVAINDGDSGIAQAGKNVSTGYTEDAADLIKAGESYTLTLKKTNTGYHTILENDETTERIMYGTDKLLQLDNESIYVGFAVARGCNVTVSDVELKITDPKTDAPALPAPEETVDVKITVNSPSTYAETTYPLVFTVNADGEMTVKSAEGTILAENVKVTAGEDATVKLDLVEGDNEFVITFVPEENYKIDGLKLTSYDAKDVKLKVSHRKFDGKTIYVEPAATAEGSGTKESPVDIYTATKYVAAGQTIELAGGTYEMTAPLKIERGINGTQNAKITLKPAKKTRAVLDFSKAKGGMQLWGDYWYVYGIDVCNTPGNIKGIQIAGNNNKIELVNTYKNGDTGLQISGSSAEGFDRWPANNLILNCTSYDNCDPGMNNADGFAAKITCGEGNIFRGCMAYNNLDDGWDLFSKIESGPIGAVVIEDSLAFNNGTLTSGEGDGDGNGFKLGGDGIAVPHVLRNSIAFSNNTAGITSNSDPAIIIENNTSFGNKGQNITLYGKGTDELRFVAKNNISMNDGIADNYGDLASLKTKDNYFFDGASCINVADEILTADIFKSTDVSVMPTRNNDGSINLNGLLVLKNRSLKSGSTLK